jgi:hypothetical protein
MPTRQSRCETKEVRDSRTSFSESRKGSSNGFFGSNHRLTSKKLSTANSTTSNFTMPRSISYLSAPASSTSNEYVLNFAFFSFVGFVAVQAVFAIIANSQSMIADCEAMLVDALTYLFNMCAERIKNRPHTPKELELSPVVRDYKRELQRLYLELIPPCISVVTLIAVTFITIREAWGTLYGAGKDGEENVSAIIMLSLSAANLVLDVVNMTCFSRANLNFSMDLMRRESISIRRTIGEIRAVPLAVGSVEDGVVSTEQTALITTIMNSEEEIEKAGGVHASLDPRVSSSRFTPLVPHQIVNLNMCSAWTVR